MEDSIWTGTVASLRGRIAGPDPVPAGVSAAAVTATFALGLLCKVLTICARRNKFTGDRNLLHTILEAARAESTILERAADQDIAAFQLYMESRALHRAGSIDATIDVPMDAVRAAARGLHLCVPAVDLVHPFVAPDLGAAASLLAGAIRAMLLSIRYNTRQLASGEPPAELQQLEERALEQAEIVRRRVLELIGQ
ncbi:MAG TPA: cyclodeaminase/cyclohydrolase family protein [Bryobacteraceae bacterium]|nr:cyclodeaminase/cyclohydrolase family protein [Bryobacteraceae bacterium]HUO29632.1 cyclodeaminase/cyclohydrolase family protein [Bryobacteraceae bacterium]